MSCVIVGIDGDIIAYQIGFVTENEPLSFALSTVKKKLNNIQEAVKADDRVVFLTGKGNFREKVASIQKYKGNRDDKPKPKWLGEIREYLIKHQHALLIEGMEADDALGEFLSEELEDMEKICASIDKDLKMIAGKHYNWNKELTVDVGKEEADNFFIEQMLTGDSADNIPGIYKITGQKATKEIKRYCQEGKTFTEKMERVKDTYRERGCEDAEKVIKEIGDLLWIRRHNYKTWEEYAKAIKTSY